MLELLNQLDGFESTNKIKVLMATNRIDILDAALLRPGRIDRKIEFPNPSESSRVDILRIHSRKMNLVRGIDLQKVADKMGGASGKEWFFFFFRCSSFSFSVFGSRILTRRSTGKRKAKHSPSLIFCSPLSTFKFFLELMTGAELKAACTEAGKFYFFLPFFLQVGLRSRTRRKTHFLLPLLPSNKYRNVRPEGAPSPRHPGGL